MHLGILGCPEHTVIKAVIPEEWGLKPGIMDFRLILSFPAPSNSGTSRNLPSFPTYEMR